MERKRAARMSGVPELTIPDILVDDDGGDDDDDDRGSRTKSFKPEEGSVARWTHLSVGEGVGQQAQMSTATEATQGDTAYQHPLSYPRSPASTTASNQGATSGFSFELYEPDGQGQGAEQARRGSAVSPSQALDMLDDSVWMESIRRSATLRRPERGSHRYGDG